jgi:cytochrome P450
VPLIQARRENPSDDLLSNLLKADGASVMSTTETVLFLLVVLAAGNETTTTLIGNTVVSLLRNRDQLELVVADPDLVVGALEESLRFEAPFQFMFKAPYEDVEIEGVRIPAGGLIAMMIGAANRDASRFTNPNRFDITRTTPHLGFGKGTHFCLGSALARMEAQIALRALVPELPNLELDETSLKQSPSLLIRGYSEINVTRR